MVSYQTTSVLFLGLIENNLLVDPRNNTFDGVISNNKFLTGVYENKFEGIIKDNVFYENVSGNSINTTNFSACLFQEFRNNFIQGGLAGIDATDTNSFNGNTINQASNLSNITIVGGADISSNEFMGSTAGGSVIWGTPFLGNSFFGSFIGVSVGNNFNHNTIRVQFNGHEGVLDGFKYNNISVVLIPTDFSLATHVYGSYDCELFRRQDGAERLRYTNNTDAIVVTDINS